MARKARHSGPPPKEASPRTRRLLFVLVAASCAASLAAIVWLRSDGDAVPHGRRVDPEHLTGEVEDMAEVAESFINFWSTFRYPEALAVSTGETRRRVELALQKEREMSPAERQIARDLKQSVAELEVRLEVSEVIDDDPERIVLRGIATASASDRQFRRHQEFVMVRVRGDWRVAAWDPGEVEGGPEGAAEPGLQGIDDSEKSRAGGATP